MNSLTKVELFDFTEEHLDVAHYLKESDDFVVRGWVNFLESHGLNPRTEHELILTVQDTLEPWENIEYDVRWKPEVVLGMNSFEYEEVYLGVCPRRTEGSANIRMMNFTPKLGYGLIK